MKKLLSLLALCAFALPAFAGWSWVTIDGQTYNVWTSPNGHWITVDGPGGPNKSKPLGRASVLAQPESPLADSRNPGPGRMLARNQV